MYIDTLLQDTVHAQAQTRMQTWTPTPTQARTRRHGAGRLIIDEEDPPWNLLAKYKRIQTRGALAAI